MPPRRSRLSSATRLAVRRLLHQLARVGLRGRSRRYAVDPGVTALVLAPHSDDETLGCGGLLFRKRAAGASIAVAYLTDGSASHPDHPTLTPAALAAQRQDEARQAMRLLGVADRDLHFLNLRDGTLADLDPTAARDAIDRIGRVLQQVQPAEIFLPCRQDGSSEHNAAFLLVQRALALAGLRPRVLEFPVWSWWNPLLLAKPLVTSRQVWRLDFHDDKAVKEKALACYKSQVTALLPGTQPMLSEEFLSFFSHGEEFFLES